MRTTPETTHIFGSDDRPVFRIIVYCLSLAFSVLVASLESVQLTNYGFGFHFGWRTVLAFALAAAVVIPCFKVAFLSPSKARRIAAFSVVAAIGIGSFLYPLRFVSGEKLAHVLTGLVIAASVLSVVGTFLFIANRLLNADQRATEAKY